MKITKRINERALERVNKNCVALKSAWNEFRDTWAFVPIMVAAGLVAIFDAIVISFYLTSLGWATMMAVVVSVGIIGGSIVLLRELVTEDKLKCLERKTKHK